jgi:putative MATE family efflux protein
VNIVLDYLLIFKWNGTGLGIEGAAIASLCAQITMFLLALGFLLVKTPFPLLPRLPINPHFKWLARMSGDLFIRTIMLNLTFYLATRYATGYGEHVIAAHTIALNIWLFSSFFIDGYAHAGNAISGALLGSGQPLSIGILGKKIVGISTGIGAALAIIYSLGYFSIADFFTPDPDVTVLFEQVFWLVIISQPINAIAFALDGLYKGLGKTKALRNLLIAATLFGFIPVAVASHYLSGTLIGIWVAFMVWMTARSGWLLWDFRTKYLKVKSGTNPPLL